MMLLTIVAASVFACQNGRANKVLNPHKSKKNYPFLGKARDMLANVQKNRRKAR